MFAVIYIPDFFLQAAVRHEDGLIDQPIALVEEDSPRSPLRQVSATAARFGVVPGMTSTQAKARCDRMKFRIRSQPQEDAAQEILLQCAYLSAAYVESTAPGVCTMDLRGLGLLRARPLAEALSGWAKPLRARLEAFHLRAHIGLAAAPDLARQAAQSGAEFRYVAEADGFWRSLPVASLGPPDGVLEILSKWGIRTVSEFLALGKNRIAERLGSAGVELFEAAKADRLRPLRLTTPRERFTETFEFDQPVETLEPLLFIVRRLLNQLAMRLELISLSTHEIKVELQLESGDNYRAALKIPSPTRKPEALFRITYNHLETVRTSSPVAGLALEVTPCEMEVQQFQLFESSVRDPNRFYETIARLNALLGFERVGTPRLRDSHRPDDFELAQPSTEAQSHAAGLALETPKPPKRGLSLRRYRPPLPAAVRLKSSTPIFLNSSGPSGAVVAARGPWKISGNWWEKLWAREEWDVQLKNGALYRIFLENNEWFLEGAYD